MNPIDEMFFLALVTILILGIVSLRLINNTQRPAREQIQPADDQKQDEGDQPEENEAEQITALIRIMRANHLEDVMWHRRTDLKNDAFAIYGLALATTGLSVAAFSIPSANVGVTQHDWQVTAVISTIAAVVFWFLGVVRYVQSRRV